MIRKELLVKGRVQQVGFRFFCQYTARLLGNLTGFAKNLDDGNVLIQVQGESEKIEKFKSSLYKGNGFSKVIEILDKEIPLAEKESRFSTLY